MTKLQRLQKVKKKEKKNDRKTNPTKQESINKLKIIIITTKKSKTATNKINRPIIRKRTKKNPVIKTIILCNDLPSRIMYSRMASNYR